MLTYTQNVTVTVQLPDSARLISCLGTDDLTLVVSNQPYAPSNLLLVFGAGWTGGDVTFTGVDPSDNTVTETVFAGYGVALATANQFVTITSAVHNNQIPPSDPPDLTNTLLVLPQTVSVTLAAATAL